ncbi:hypothetical protein Hanom_Chr16g01494751 [Helianthus anomalus]
MVKPDLDLWTGTDPIFRVVNRFRILCLIGSRVGSGRVGFFLLLIPSSNLVPEPKGKSGILSGGISTSPPPVLTSPLVFDYT